MSKKCNKCGEVKELTDFYKNKRLKGRTTNVLASDSQEGLIL